MKTYLSEPVLEDIDVSNRSYNFKIALNKVIKIAEENGIPCFFAWKTPGYNKDYEYGGILPEDVDVEDVSTEYGKFIRFFQVCAELNEDHKSIKIHKSKDKK